VYLEEDVAVRRSFVGLVALILTGFALSSPAYAGVHWCKTDPVVRLDGTLVDITVSIPAEYLFAVDGPTEIVVRTPEGVERELILNDLGFMGKGSVVRFVDGSGEIVDGGFPISVEVYVPMDEAQLLSGELAPVEVAVLPHSGDGLTSVVGTHRWTRVSPVAVASQY